MLSKEVEYGNIEYKRYILKSSLERLQSLITQMNWRLNEGNGCCFYYIGVNDDGSIYGINDDEYDQTINMLKIMSEDCNAIIKYISYNTFYKVRIEKINNNIEYRILLIGNSGVGKTTFLANLIKGKLNKNYIVNHKHEYNNKTSSINYYNLHNKYLFFDSPGDEKYQKTLNKIINNIDFNLIINFSNDFYYLNEIKKINNNIVDINDIYDYNLNTIIDKNKFINNITNYLQQIKNKTSKFNIIQSYYNNDIGYILCGFLTNGKMNVDDTYYLQTKNNKYKIKVNSIYKLNKNINNITGPATFSINIDYDGEYEKFLYINLQY